MGTRGFISVVADGVTKTAYNHFDSYPDGLGVEMLGFAQALAFPMQFERFRAAARRLTPVSEDVPPTEEQKRALERWADTGVATGSTDDWYVLLRHTQGEIAAMLEAGYFLDASEFPGDSLFAEWGYVIDFDARLFEVYVGFQEEAHAAGRFAHLPVRERSVGTYWPVALAEFWPLDALPGEEDFLAATEKSSDGEDDLLAVKREQVVARWNRTRGERLALFGDPKAASES